jgi:hypothetical protein
MDLNTLKHKLHGYRAKGSKESRARTVKRVYQFLEYCRTRGGKTPDQIGRKLVYQWLSEDIAQTTRRDRFYALRLFWRLMDRGEIPDHIRKVGTGPKTEAP